VLCGGAVRGRARRGEDTAQCSAGRGDSAVTAGGCYKRLTSMIIHITHNITQYNNNNNDALRISTTFKDRFLIAGGSL